MRIRVQIYFDNGTLIIENVHQIDWPGEHGWAMHPADGMINEGDHEYSGYTLEVQGRQKNE